eukprot:176013_1
MTRTIGNTKLARTIALRYDLPGAGNIFETAEDALSYLRNLLQYQESGTNLQLAVEVAKRFTKQLTSEKLIDLFEEFDWWSGLYLYLGNMVKHTQDSKIIFKYIVAASEVGEFAEIELICRE